MSSSSSTSDNTKLLLTAVGAALAGAGVAYAAMSQQQKQQEAKEAEEQRSKFARSSRPSFIMEDRSTDISMQESTKNVVFPHNHEEKMRRRIAARVAVEEDNMTPRRSVTVRVPATSANMGPGCEWNLYAASGGWRGREMHWFHCACLPASLSPSLSPTLCFFSDTVLSSPHTCMPLLCLLISSFDPKRFVNHVFALTLLFVCSFVRSFVHSFIHSIQSTHRRLLGIGC